MSIHSLTPLLAAWQARPKEIRYACASESELLNFEAKHEAIPLEFRFLLANFGGGAIGTEWVDGIEQLGETHMKFKAESGLNGWSLKDTFIIGWDGCGNPFGIHLPTRAIVTEDHNFGDVHEIASSFEAFLRNGL
ncbi:MAG: SMI1/KNR4 family protein [Proteobacteria bacterium]|nr:MAG: SMI1/KNR4 family protein [Pseudomonadota bacterium]